MAHRSVPLSPLSAQIIDAPAKPFRLLLVGDKTACPVAVREMVASRNIEMSEVATLREAREPRHLNEADGVILISTSTGDGDQPHKVETDLLAHALISNQLMGIVLASDMAGVVSDADDAFMPVDPGISAEQLWGRLAGVHKFRSQIRRMGDQVSTMQRLGKRLNQNLVEVDQELRFASRLQRDFLPKHLPEVGQIRFGAIYKPASWVSGDSYDVRRLDENTIGFFLADAMGHGVAAGLLTMFIKEAIVGKQVHHHSYVIVPPEDVLAVLNRELSEQDLPNCQFVTGCYGTVDTQTNEIVFSRGGHPHPIHIGADGSCAEVRTVGGLLGVFPEEEFPSVRLTLKPGERLFLYSDGLEDTIISRKDSEQGGRAFAQPFLDAIQLPGMECLESLSNHLDSLEGSLCPQDDQTCLVIERIDPSSST